MSIFLLILAFILPPIGLPVLVIYFFTRKKVAADPSRDKNWYLQLTLSREDTVSQWFLLLSVFFLGVTMLSFNRDMGEPLTWSTVVFFTSIIGLLCTYYFKVISTLIGSLFGLIAWWISQANFWIQGKEIRTSVILVGFTFMALLYYVLGHIHEKEFRYKRFAMVYLILGIIFVTVVLFFLSTKIGIGVLEEMTKGSSFLGSWQITVSLFLFFIALAGAVIYSAWRKLLFWQEVAAVFILTFLFGIIVWLPQQSLFIPAGSYLGSNLNKELSTGGVMWAILFNFAAFFELLGLIFSGYIRREEWLINLGTVFLFILIIVKYFDWFFSFLDKSIFFMGAGILLFGLGWFMEKGRRLVVANIKTEQKRETQ